MRRLVLLAAPEGEKSGRRPCEECVRLRRPKEQARLEQILELQEAQRSSKRAQVVQTPQPQRSTLAAMEH